MSYFRSAFKINPAEALRNKERAEREKQMREDLDKLLNAQKTKKKSTVVPQEFIAVKLLLLHYSGALASLRGNDNKKVSKFLSVLFNTDGSENIRKALSNVGGINSKFINERNLETVISIFKECGMQEYQELAEKDLIKYRKKHS